MPAPYRTLAELTEQADTYGIDILAHILDTAHAYGWTDAHTVEVLNAARRDQQHANTNHEPSPVALAVQFAEELRREDDPRSLTLADTVVSYLSALATYEQTGDPDQAWTLETLEDHMRALVGLAHENPDDDHDQP